ncbi:UDP-N-acetylmuramate dehydrogenase [Reichenbachiella faecimaris]|uniref:UDP-N-acetylenolpyruvoylglucosamine reductase n=1 Tax=Reichenbachiella faecimaris TaxID=692418 RepID=A0A1W2G753_REIFA|nr:UDP-N-acetylmuramate dehydrogenase [Reichenbachiella faecimaris]SMD32510.1 UDP-N-acetylmuramate dehydrogenase [Reichenbachiella faecimaris]
MPNILKQAPLKKYNTFGIESVAQQLIEVTNNQEIKEAIEWAIDKDLEPIFLGGGSNVLFTQHVYPLVIINRVTGIKKLDEDEDFVWVEAGAGEVWHNLVLYCIKMGWGGVENLSLIPGTVGAAPMQNIGAYGVEIKEVFESLEAINLASLEEEKFTNSDCEFAYRESIFKKDLKGKYFITSIVLKLMKKHKVNISYGAIADVLAQEGISNPTIKQVSDAVIQIRASKLPNPAEIGNAGSFFKNPVIGVDHFVDLKKKYPNMPSYAQPDGQVKVPAGWLIEQCGWKGSKEGEIGVHKNQALVLVNYGQGTGHEIKDLAMRIKTSVNKKFNIEIIPEVNII